MARLVAGAVALLLGAVGVAPEGLRDAFLHYPAHLAAGGVVLYHDGQVAELLPVKEVEAFVCKAAALIPDVAAFGVIAFVCVFHGYRY